jgi:integrase
MPTLTKSYVDRITPDGRESFHWDEAVKGFGVKVFASGVKSFVFQYRSAEGRTRRFTIGRLSDSLTPEQARRRAKELLRSVLAGNDPQGERRTRREAWTVNELLDAYLASPRFAEKAESTQTVDRGRINRHLRPTLGTRFADQVTRDDVLRAQRAITNGATKINEKTGRARGRAIVTGGKGTADKAVLALRAAYAWAIDNGHLEANPATGVKIDQAGERTVILEDADAYKRLFKAIDTLEAAEKIRPTVADALRLLALTGARRAEIAGLRWRWVDLKNGRIVIPKDKHKTGRRTGKDRIIALPSVAREIIARQAPGAPDAYVFQPMKGNGGFISLQKPWATVWSEAKLPEGLTMHGLRHSVGSHMAMDGASLAEIMQVLGHQQTKTAMRYIHFADQARNSLAERAASVALAGMRADEKTAEVVTLESSNAA